MLFIYAAIVRDKSTKLDEGIAMAIRLEEQAAALLRLSDTTADLHTVQATGQACAQRRTEGATIAADAYIVLQGSTARGVPSELTRTLSGRISTIQQHADALTSLEADVTRQAERIRLVQKVAQYRCNIQELCSSGARLLD